MALTNDAELAERMRCCAATASRATRREIRAPSTQTARLVLRAERTRLQLPHDRLAGGARPQPARSGSTPLSRAATSLRARYDELLAQLAAALPPMAACERYSAWHLYVVRLHRDRSLVSAPRRCSTRCAQPGIGVNVHYIPVHLQPYYRTLGFTTGMFPEAERYEDEAITLPLFPRLTEAEQDTVVAALRAVLGEDRGHPGARRQQAHSAQEHPHFCGKPMIAWSIAAARKRLFDSSSSRPTMRRSPRSRGARAPRPFIRPAELADDYTGTAAVVRHAVAWFGTQRMSGSRLLLLCHGRFVPARLHHGPRPAPARTPPSPFRSPAMARRSSAPCASRRRPGGDVPAGIRRTRSQDLEPASMTPDSSIGAPPAWMSGAALFSKASAAVVLPRERVLDIDTPEDWSLAEALFRIQLERSSP